METPRDNPGTANSTHEKLWSPIFVTIIAAMLFAFMVGQGTNAGTTVYLERTGGTIALAGIGAMAFSVAAGIMRLVSGPAIDGRGRRLVMLIGAAFMLLGTIGPLFVNDGIPFIIWRALQGIGFSAATTAANTAAADVLPLSRLGEGIGYAGLGQAISMAVGPALALFLVSTNPPENFYFGLIACASISLLLTLLWGYEKDPSKLPASSGYRTRWESSQAPKASEAEDSPEVTATAHETNPFHRMLNAVFEPTALRGTFVILLMATLFSFNIFFMGSFGNSLEVTNSGFYYTVTAIVMIFIRIGTGRFMDSVTPLKLMAVACGCGIIAFAIGIGCATGAFGGMTEMLFYSMGLPFGICMGLGIPVNQTVAVRMTPPERWGAANALFMLGVDVSNAVASVVWGFLIQNLGYAAALIGCVIMLVLSFVAAFVLYPKP